MVAMPIAMANLIAFLASGFWGYVADVLGRRWAMIIPAAIGALVTPFYLLFNSYPMVAGAFIVQGAFLGAIYGQNPAYLSERFPTEVRATASGFCYHQGAIWAGFTGPILTYFAASQPHGLHHPDADRDDGRGDRVRHHLALQPGDQGQGAGAADHAGGAACGIVAGAADRGRKATDSRTSPRASDLRA